MVKKASMKISKDEKNKKDFDSWLNVLRPKVYITDSSSFKSLVQELTGITTSSPSSSPSPPPSSSSPIISSSSPSLELEPQVVVVDQPESYEVDDYSSHDDQHQLLLTTTNQIQDRRGDYDQLVCGQIWLEDTSTLLQDFMANDDQQGQEEDLLAYGSLESWLLDIDNHPYNPLCNNNGFVQNYEQEVSIYDYELSGLL